MPEPKENPDLCTILLNASQKAMEGAHFEAAYHTLTAALHVARDMQRADYAEVIETVALSQLAHINQYAPKNTMATPAADERFGVDMYSMLAH